MTEADRRAPLRAHQFDHGPITAPSPVRCPYKAHHGDLGASKSGSLSDHGQQRLPAEKLPSHYPRRFGTPIGSRAAGSPAVLCKKRNPGWAPYYANRILGTALCQGAAWHYIRGDVGINDFDVYTFYAANAERTWYARRIARLDFGNSKFGRSEVSGRGYTGRRMNLLGRALNVLVGADLTESLRRYLKSPKTGTSRELGKKAVVLLEPRMGEIVWPADGI
jgi:hypothetical protein